jgi:hypothetical protein
MGWARIHDPFTVVVCCRLLQRRRQLDWALLQQLRSSQPMAEQVAVDRVTVLRQGVVLQQR